MTDKNSWFYTIGISLIAFILGTMLVLPIFSKEQDPLDLIQSQIQGIKPSVLSDDPVDNPAYDYWYAPSNSFGISEMKEVNWTTFRNLFKNNFQYSLEYRISDTWVENNDYLTVGADWQDDGYWKINLTFTKPPSPEMDVRFTIGMNKVVLDYVERADQYEYWINYTANNTEVYNCFFNWSDLMSIPGLVFNHGVTDSLFWFRFRKDDVPQNTEEKVYVFDPIFGGQDTAVNFRALYLDVSTNRIYVLGQRGLVSDGDGIVDNITTNFATVDTAKNVQCALYEYTSSQDAGNLIATTETKSVDSTGIWVFDFSEPKPTVTDDTNYFICMRGADSAGNYDLKIYGATSGGTYSGDNWKYYTASTVSFDDPFMNEDGETWSFYLYASYTVGGGEPENNIPSSKDEAPTNNTDCVDYVAGGKTVSAVVYDNDGDDMNVTWWSNSSGSWKQFGVANSSVANNTNVSMKNVNFTTDNTKYWWWMLIDDGEDGLANDSYSFTICENTTTWQTIDDTFNGIFTNTTTWTTIDDTFNGVFINTTSWQTIDDTYNGVFTNATTWQIIDNTFNGIFTNTSIRTWQTIDDTFNGIFTNSTSWKPIDSTYNGIFTNSTSWKTIDSTYNGIFTNSTSWKTIDDTYNGIFTNTTTWTTIDDTFNGVFTNITSWYTIDDTFNGVFINTTSWQTIDDTYNGVFTNATGWKTVDNTYNGIFTNTTTWKIIDNTYNGIFTNTSIRTWQTIDDTFNGVFINTTSWQIVDNTFNGVFTNLATNYIIITNVYPSNNTYSISLQPYLYATFNSTLGNNLNITWRYNSTSLGIEGNVTNGTYNELLIFATAFGTSYTWEVQVNDGEGNYLNTSYNFITETNTKIMGGNQSILGVVGVIGLIGFIFFIIMKRRRKKNVR